MEKIFFHLFCQKTSGKNFFPLVLPKNKWKNIFSTCFYLGLRLKLTKRKKKLFSKLFLRKSLLKPGRLFLLKPGRLFLLKPGWLFLLKPGRLFLLKSGRLFGAQINYYNDAKLCKVKTTYPFPFISSYLAGGLSRSDAIMTLFFIDPTWFLLSRPHILNSGVHSTGLHGFPRRKIEIHVSSPQSSWTYFANPI